MTNKKIILTETGIEVRFKTRNGGILPVVYKRDFNESMYTVTVNCILPKYCNDYNPFVVSFFTKQIPTYSSAYSYVKQATKKWQEEYHSQYLAYMQDRLDKRKL